MEVWFIIIFLCKFRCFLGSIHVNFQGGPCTGRGGHQAWAFTPFRRFFCSLATSELEGCETGWARTLEGWTVWCYIGWGVLCVSIYTVFICILWYIYIIIQKTYRNKGQNLLIWMEHLQHRNRKGCFMDTKMCHPVEIPLNQRYLPVGWHAV